MAPQLPKLAFQLVTSNNGSNFAPVDYATAHLLIHKLGSYTDGEIWTTKLFEFDFSTSLVNSDKEQPTPIQPAAYYQHAERWQYRTWYNPDVKISCGLWQFEEAAKTAQELLKKIGKVQQEYNLTYRYSDPLELLIHSLLRAGYRQVYEHKYKWYLNAKDVFSREDRQYDREPAHIAHAVYPWTIQPEPVAA